VFGIAYGAFLLYFGVSFWQALLVGAIARFPHTFLVLKIGGMWTTFLFTLALLVPIFGIAHVVQDPTTPFSTLLFWAGVAGFCAGGQISSSSANISLWFPKRLGGTALGVNVGIGNLGTSVAQFLVPAVITAGSSAPTPAARPTSRCSTRRRRRSSRPPRCGRRTPLTCG